LGEAESALRAADARVEKLERALQRIKKYSDAHIVSGLESTNYQCQAISAMIDQALAEEKGEK
jgi:hypothetical protein